MKLLSQQFEELFIQLEVILLEVLEEIISAQHLSDLDELIEVAIPHKKWLFLEDLHSLLVTIDANMAPVDHISSE